MPFILYKGEVLELAKQEAAPDIEFEKIEAERKERKRKATAA